MTFRYMLAPLEGFTVPAFRTLCHNHGADLTFTEMVRVDALARHNKATWERLDMPDATPTVIQLLVSKEEPLKEFLKEYKPGKGFQGFNLNLGCSSPEIVGAGMGAALVKRISKVSGLVKIIREYDYPVSIKMRLGLSRYEKKKKAYLNLINEVDADYFAVHARTGAETYANKADWGGI